MTAARMIVAEATACPSIAEENAMDGQGTGEEPIV
jgi:hypothetical protein